MRWSRGLLVALAAVVLAALIAQVAVAGSGGEPQAGASAVTNKQLKKLKKQISKLKKQVDELVRQPGPPGPPGSPGSTGSAPACQGNGSGDQMVAAGAVCIDKYEVSVWSSPTGGTQYGAGSDDYPCNDNGQDCTDLYARSVPGVTPSRFITWFQAQQALANVGKRLPTNAEWQQAVAGTPDSSACNVLGALANTGANAGCVSSHGANDMVGNLAEWVGDWDEQAIGCATWPAGFGSDFTCLGRGSGEASTRFPGALFRGGTFSNGSDAGPFTVVGSGAPSNSVSVIGFRGAR